MIETETKRRNSRSLGDMFYDLHIEKINVMFCKHLLGVIYNVAVSRGLEDYHCISM